MTQITQIKTIIFRYKIIGKGRTEWRTKIGIHKPMQSSVRRWRRIGRLGWVSRSRLTGNISDCACRTRNSV